MPDPNTDRSARTILWGAGAALLVLSVFQMLALARVERRLDEMQAAAAKKPQDGAGIEDRLDEIERLTGKIDGDQGLLVSDVERLTKRVDQLRISLEGRDRAGQIAADAPPEIDWTVPALFEQARKSCAEYGIELTKDEVRIPARFILRQGTLEFLAVLKGGKAHESLFSLEGNTPRTERRPRDFGARLNNAIQALGFKRGRPVSYEGGGRTPPSGETAYLFAEWEENGQKVLVRAEDLVWNRFDERPMERGTWVYVGSMFVQGEDAALPVFAADLTAEAVACYSQSPDTMFDTRSEAGADQTAYLVATPRIPQGVEQCTFVIRRTDREPTRTYPDPPKDGGSSGDK